MRAITLAAMLLLVLSGIPMTWAQTSIQSLTPGTMEKPASQPITTGALPENTLTLSLGEEYNDNVNEEARARSDWVSIANAVGRYTYQSARINFIGVVDGSYNFYALGNRADELKGNGQAQATIAVVPGLLFIEGQDQIRQVFTHLTEGESNQNDSSRGQVFQNTSVVRTYLNPRFWDRLALKAGCDYTTTAYDSAENNKQSYGIFLQSAYDLHQKLQVTTDSEAKHQSSKNGTMDSITVSGGSIWEFSTNGNMKAKAGPRFIRYNDGSSDINLFWNAMAAYTYKRYTIALDTSSIYDENPSTTYSTRNTKFGAALTSKSDRSEVQARAEYSHLDGQDTTETKRLTLRLSASYELAPRMTLKASASREQGMQSGDSNTRWYANGSLEYALGERYTATCYYSWKRSESSNGGNDNYSVNRLGINLKRIF